MLYPKSAAYLPQFTILCDLVPCQVRLSEYGSKLIEVADNGHGVSPENYEALTLKYHTSKLSEFAGLQEVATYGFRGEALSSLCGVADVSVITRTAEQDAGVKLVFDHTGAITSKGSAARSLGTTVAVRDLFKGLPVRCKVRGGTVSHDRMVMHMAIHQHD